MSYLILDMKNTRFLGIFMAAVFLLILGLLHPAISLAANLTSIKDTLQTSRMSFSGRVKTPTSGGHVYIYTVVSGNFTSISTDGLKPSDVLQINGTNYTIATIVNSSEFTTTTSLAGGDATDGNSIYFKSKPGQIITFNTASAVNGGFFQVLIPAAASNFNDTIPDATGFDFNSAVTATASSVTNYTFVAGVATVSGGTGCTSPANYHCFEFHYTGPGAIGTGIQLFIGLSSGTNTLIAPAPSAGRVASQADQYKFRIYQFTNNAQPGVTTETDFGAGTIAVIESVRVTATVDPSITFKIEGVPSSTLTCGLTTSVTTTSASVPFGVLTLDTFRWASQKITVSTNAASGYAVTSVENERLSNLAGSPIYIPNTTCDSGTCTTTSGSGWVTAAGHPGFGYTLAIVSGTPTITPTVGNFVRFASLAAAANELPTQIISNAGIASSQAVYVCYQISVDATQAAGEYENQVTYTATATF